MAVSPTASPMMMDILTTLPSWSQARVAPYTPTHNAWRVMMLAGGKSVLIADEKNRLWEAQYR